jgi:tRNA(fMet)-specific endonuclease VapC
MILLDTDHLTVLGFPGSAQCDLLKARLEGSVDPLLGTTVVSAEEQLRGLLASVASARGVHGQITPYARLIALLEFLNDWRIVPFDSRAADRFEQLRAARVRIGSQDLKIASIALVNDALLLSANLRDFRKVPGLRVEDWLA